jgi:hypothetical protein
MVELYGLNWTLQELLQRVGRVSQLGGVRLGDLADGNSRGVRTAEFETGSGFGFQVLLDRGMDICAAKFHGASLSWEAAPGPAHPAYHERVGWAGCAPSTAAWWPAAASPPPAPPHLWTRRQEPGAARPPEPSAGGRRVG